MKRFCLARIATAHGVKGLVKLILYTDDPQALSDYTFFTKETGESDTVKLTMKNSMGKYWLAAIDGVSDRTEAEKLRGLPLYVDRQALPSTDDDEFYMQDMIGLNAITESGETVGNIIDVQNFGAGDLMEVKPDTADSFYIPFDDEYVGDVDMDKQSVTVFNYEGFM
jgi:16S rRNA processing protein RimM